MPTYDYECPDCEHAFEEFQSITAEPLQRCPECGKQRLRRLIGAGAGLIFKGSGFYQTDYRSDSYKKSAKADKEIMSSKSDTTKDSKSNKTGSTKSDKKASSKSK